MHSQDEYNQVLSYSMQAMALMLKNKTPATPENYAKWYKHAADLFNADQSEDDDFSGWSEDEMIQSYSDRSILEVSDDELTPTEALQVSSVKDLVEKTADETKVFNSSMDDISQKLEAFKRAKNSRKPKGRVKKKTPPSKPAFANKSGSFVPFNG